MFIIFGAPRSGTTLLSSSLNLNDSIVIPHETDFIVPLSFVCRSVKDKAHEALETFGYEKRPWPGALCSTLPGKKGNQDSHPKKNRAICILGMHRSGTSAIARAVNLLGPYIGEPEHLMKPVEGDNPHGFWELWSIFSFHEKLLSFLSRSWDNILPPPDGWWKEPKISPFRDELKGIIQAEFGGQQLWLWKDPRTSLLLPLWQEVLRELDIEVSYLICVRNPLDVSASLMRRNNFSKEKSLSLWLLYNVSALYVTNGTRRFFLNFDDLLEHWEPSLRKVSTFFGIPWPEDDNELRKSIAVCLHPEERHSRSDTELLMQDKEVADPVKKMYRLLLTLLEGTDILDSEHRWKEVEDIYLDYARYARIFAPSMKRPHASEGWRSPLERVNMLRERREENHSKPPFGTRIKEMPPAELREIAFPVFSNTRVSIIIPVWNHWEHTYRCLQSVLANTDEVPYEVIIVDNGSSDRTEEVLVNSKNITVIRNRSNAGFVRACNQGAEVARGEYLVFLNNDTEPLPGWLEELVDAAGSEATVGAVGAKLIYPDGTLQEAGGIIFSDGRGWNFGNGEDPYEEIYNVACQVDYCSGACLLVKKDLFVSLGGLDERYSPAYYEDTDMCFSIRKLGFKVLYNPRANVIHYESVTAGVDESAGMRKYLEINRKKFVGKWETELLLQDAHPSETGRLPVTSCRERLTRKDLSSEDFLWVLCDKKTGLRQYPGPAAADIPVRYRHLDEKEKKAVDVIITAARRYGHENIGIAWTCGEDSTVLLHLVRQAFEGCIPFKVISVLTAPMPPEVCRLIDRLRMEWGFTLMTFSDVDPGQSTGPVEGSEWRSSSSGILPLGKAAELVGARALITGERWGGKKPSSSCVYFSHREVPGCVTVKPMLHFSELDVWQYIKKYSISLLVGHMTGHVNRSPQPAAVVKPLSEFNARLSVLGAPRFLKAYAVSYIRVGIKNAGKAFWFSGEDPDGRGSVNLSYHWIDKNGRMIEFDGMRTPLTDNVAPDGEIVLDAAVMTPPLPEEYTLEFDLVQEGVVWFQEKGSETAKVSILVEH